MHIMDTQHNNNNNVTFCVYYAKIVVRVLTHSPLAFGSWTMRQNPDYYFGIVHSKCNIIILIDQCRRINIKATLTTRIASMGFPYWRTVYMPMTEDELDVPITLVPSMMVSPQE